MQFRKTLVRLPLILLRPYPRLHQQPNPQPLTLALKLQRRRKGEKIFVPFILLLLPFIVTAQTTYLPQGDKANTILERLEIKRKTDSALNFSKNKPHSRASFMKSINEWYGEGTNLAGFSKVDLYNLRSLMMNNIEWVGNRDLYKSKKPVAKRFWQTPANLWEVHVKDFDLIINPSIQVTLGKEKDNDGNLFLNSRGLNLRGRIANKIGFYALVTDNQERVAFYVRDWVNLRQAVPGVGFYKRYHLTGYDYFDARGYFTFNVTKYIDVAFGYDKNFIGNGYRSLLLSDVGNSNLFLKLNTRIWKLNYQNLFMDLHSATIPGGDKLVPKKFAAIHHLDVSVTKWLNIGLFESVVFGRKDRFDFGYLNPIIFYRSIEQQNGSFDNSIAGFDFKANLAKKIQVYGQLSIDELLFSEITKNTGFWGNKWGIQLGAKYIDAFGISNLDLQVEHNRVRPFTYSHRDSVANYTHYNQPMAHPLGANFSEYIGIARYQPAPKWLIVGKLIAYTQGRDSSALNYGSNILLPNIPPYRVGDYGYSIGGGWKTSVFYASLLLSYEFRENLFLELNAVARKQETKTAPIMSSNTTVINFGVRWNMHRREFDY